MNFDDLQDGGIAMLEDVVQKHTEETYNLEFKQKHNPFVMDLHKDDRRALGEALSGFANATGGLLVIGIRTERPHGVDRAAELKMINNASAVAERYRAYMSDCVSPKIENLRVASIASPTGEGAIIVDVPRGNARPHMSMAPAHQRHYRRVADSFVPILHYEAEEMMRLKTSPSLQFVWKQQGGHSLGTNKIHYIAFGLRNVSRATAKFPFISFYAQNNGPRLAEYGLDGNSSVLWPKLGVGSSDAITFAGGADRVIHPGQEFFVSRLEYADEEDQRVMRYWGLSNLGADSSIDLIFDYGCEDCPTQTSIITLTSEGPLIAQG